MSLVQFGTEFAPEVEIPKNTIFLLTGVVHVFSNAKAFTHHLGVMYDHYIHRTVFQKCFYNVDSTTSIR